MTKIEQTIVYPYNILFTPVLRHRELLSQYQIVGLISPNGWGITGKDAGWADEGPLTGIIVSENFTESLDRCETVLFCEAYWPVNFDVLIRPKMLQAINRGKNIVCTMEMQVNDCLEIAQQCSLAGVSFTYLNSRQLTASIKPVDTVADNEVFATQIVDLNTPVICVAGVNERTNKFQIELALRQHLTTMGYKVSQVGSRNYCEMLGFHSIPPFMYDNRIPEPQKIALFNKYVKTLEKKEEPDVIIIGIPGGIMPINKMFTNDFGLMSYRITQAIEPDTLIISVLFEEYDGEYFDLLARNLRIKMGCSVSCFNLANTSFNWIASREAKRRFYTTLNSRYIDEKVAAFKRLPTPVFNILNPNDASQMTNYIVNVLSGSEGVEVV